MNMEHLGRPVYTRLGKGKVVYQMPDGTIVVEFEHGGGHIFLPGELRLSAMGRGKETGDGNTTQNRG